VRLDYHSNKYWPGIKVLYFNRLVMAAAAAGYSCVMCMQKGCI